MNCIDSRPAGHSPRAWDDDDNAPWLPKIPGPRKPGYAQAGAR
ncbi:hypothetical protein [Streptomyces sp. YIM S03343]